MSNNYLILRKPAELETITKLKEKLFSEIPCVQYSMMDSARYTFEYQINEGIDVNMFESDRTYDSDEFIDAEFENTVSEKDHSYFKVAAVSGTIAGVFSRLKITEEMFDKLHEWKNTDWEKFVLLIAQIIGYKKGDYKGAAEYVFERFVSYADCYIEKEIQSGIDDFLNRLSSHPSLAGLIFSVFTQFSGKLYKLGEAGIEEKDIPDYYAIGRNIAEKMVYGFLYWAFSLSIDVVASRKSLLDDIKIPAEIIKLLKEFASVMSLNISIENIGEAEKLYSQWIRKVFEKSPVNKQEETFFDIREEMEKAYKNAFSSEICIIANECFVRTFYFVKKLLSEMKTKNISSIEKLDQIDVANILPFNNRLISRMILISSACFVGTNVVGATIKAIKGKLKNEKKFSETFIAEICIAGVGRLVFAVIADSKYWTDDIKIFFRRKEKKNSSRRTNEDDVFTGMAAEDVYKAFSLNYTQSRVLYSLEAMEIINDINRTVNIEDRTNKQQWFDLWKSQIINGPGMNSQEYFVDNDKEIYSEICSIDPTEENLRWFYLLTMELVLFKPYFALGAQSDDKFVKLSRVAYNYIDDQFSRRQTIVNQAEIEAVRSEYKRYKNALGGNTPDFWIAAGIMALTAVAAGGLAYAFAPHIAVMIAGDAVAGLHGAALTSASLAFVGGGSLAAGGLGMAGGTAIITGGGALLGMTGSGIASLGALLSETSNAYWVSQNAKLLVFCRCVLKDVLKDKKTVEKVYSEVCNIIKKIESNLKDLEKEKCSLDTELIKNLKEYLKYLNKCKVELDKLLKEMR